MLKSGVGTVTETVAEWEKVVEFLAVTVMLYVPGEVLAGTESVKFDCAVPLAGTIIGFTLKLLVRRPGGDDGDDDKVTEPAKLLRPVIETVEFAFDP